MIILHKLARKIISFLENFLKVNEEREMNRHYPLYEVLPDVDIIVKDRDVLSEIADRADKIMEEKRLYLDPNFTLEHLAREVWSNRTYMSRALRLKRGVSFREYVSHFRLKYARGLCENAGYGASDLAIKSGFNDVRTFNRASDDFLF